jgi:hypothetical protein
LNSVSAEILATIGQDKKQWYDILIPNLYAMAEQSSDHAFGPEERGTLGGDIRPLATSMTLVSSESDIG